MRFFQRLLLAVVLFSSLQAFAQPVKYPVQLDDIRVEGLQRVSPETIFAVLPLNIGDSVSASELQSATRSVFRTGYFDDIQLGFDGNVLVITVDERPAIAEIMIDGNKAIETDKLLDALKKSGLAEGLIFKQATLEGIAQELLRQYVAQGRYDADVKTDVVELPGNRVTVSISIKEGKVATIKHINIVGNTSFATEDLLALFEQETSGWFSWMNSKDKYSREKLTGDLERLKSFYLDRGYIRFSIDSTQVSLSKNRKSIFITINITEGGVYTVNKVDLAGELIIPEEDVRKLIVLNQGYTFSQVLMTTSSEYITQRLGNDGYTFTEVRGLTDIDDENRTVDVTFFVNPGERTYVRRINFRGNTKTADEVARREMRQMESALASSSKIEQSKIRLQRLGFFKSIDLETVEVPGTGDQIDLEYLVEEQPSGSLGASIGFAQGSGVVLGANIQQDNFLGTGKHIGFNVSTSSYTDQVTFSYIDPYFTADGVSRGFEIFYITRDLDEVNISSYSVDSYGLNLNYGYPISEVESIGFGFGYANTDVTIGVAPAQEISATPILIPGVSNVVNYSVLQPLVDPWDVSAAMTPVTLAEQTINPPGFLDKYGTEFDDFKMSLSWGYSTLNRGRLATRGASQRLGFDFTLPGSDMEYWKLSYQGQLFKPLSNDLTLRLRGRFGWGDGYGGTGELPFFENYFSGGYGSVRGFKRNTLGPRSTPAQGYLSYLATYNVPPGTFGNPVYARCDIVAAGVCPVANNKLATGYYNDIEGDPFGGNILLEGSVELIFPMPFIKDQSAIQSALFLDMGNVFDDSCGASQVNCEDLDIAELRYSIGVGVTWITGFGPLTFSLAKALNASGPDETEFFQFSLGQSF